MTKPEPINGDRETAAKSVNAEPDKTKKKESSSEATRHSDDKEQGSSSVGRYLQGEGADAAGIDEAKREHTTVELDTNTANFFADLDAIRLSLEDAGEISTREILTRVPVRRPRKGEYFRCHPDPKMSLSVTIYVDHEEQDEVYFVAPAMRGELAEDLRAVLLQLTISRKGVVFIWPLTIPSDENPLGRSWHETALKAREIAKTRWIRITPDKSLGGYRAREAEGRLSEPEWPDKSFNEFLTIAFADRIIVSDDHPVVRRLRGLV
jgi:hypothetical protein